MQCLEKLHAAGTSIEELPNSIGLLSRLQELDVRFCGKVKNLPSSLRNLTSLTKLDLEEKEGINLPDMVKDMKLKSLNLIFITRSWLHVILSLSSLEELTLHIHCQISSSTESYSLSKLSNLRGLSLYDSTLEMLSDLSSLKQLKRLRIYSDISLQSLPPLPPNLEELEVDRCTGLQYLPDLSNLKELGSLRVLECSDLKSNSLKQSFLHQVGQHKLYSFQVDLPDREVAEWFSYRSSGDTLSFTVPPNSGDTFCGIGLWIVYKCKDTHRQGYVRAVITNKTKDIIFDHGIFLPWNTVAGQVQSRIEYRRDNRMKSGDRIKISFQSLPDPYDEDDFTGGSGAVKVKKCGAHLILRSPSFSY